MDQVAELKSAEILEIRDQTHKIFRDLFEQKKSIITDIPRKTFKYGPTDRHNLDIYYPVTPSSGKAPVLVYLYGGGFVTGDRVLEAPDELIYPNVGAFFARQGFITVIPDYRLAPGAKYPEPVEDVRDAIIWLRANSDKLVSQDADHPDTDSIFVVGHSAGATHAATLLLDPDVLPPNSDLRSKIKGVVLVSGVYHLNIPTGLDIPAEMYWGSVENIKSQNPLRLLQCAKENGIATLPSILLVEAEHEPPPFFVLRADFQATLAKFLDRSVKLIKAGRHNHISLYAALSSGQGEEWAVEAAAWMNSNM